MIKVFVQKTMAQAVVDAPLTSGSKGLTVEFVFSEDWNGLEKTAVFETSSFYKETEQLTGETIEVPEDVMAWANETLYVGVYGTSQNGATVIPTVYADCGRIQKGANDSEGGRPLIPAQSDILQNQIDSLGDRVAWLEETGGGGGGAGIFLDTTLTQSGKAADAKAVGDALEQKQDAGNYLTDHNTFVGDVNTSSAEFYEAFSARKPCFLLRSDAGSGMVMWVAHDCTSRAARFYNAAPDGTVRYATLEGLVFSYESAAGGSGNVFVGDENTTVAEFATAYQEGKVCFMKRPQGGSGIVTWVAYNCSTSGATFYHVNSVGIVEYGRLTSDGSWSYTAASGGGAGGVSEKVDTAKYGITAADYVAPFTASMYKVAYQNGVGIQNAINDAKAKGLERITLPAGNYPLCYHASADEEYNAIIDASGIDFYGDGVKLYVIYDEEGTNPYFTGATPRLLMGTIIKTDRDVRGFHLVGERRFRKDVNTKYRDNSKGIGLTRTSNGNTIKDCLIECVSGDGIGNESYMEQLAGWTPDTFTSIEWDYTTGAYVESNYMFVSAEHGGDWIDKTRPLLIRCTGYFLYSSAPLVIRCWNSEGEHIGVVQFWQGEYFYLPENTAKWRLELTRTVWHETTVTETWSFWIGYGTYSGTKIINCESRLNQRGGMSNLPNNVLVKDCYIHNNGNAGEGMVQYYDTTRFGIDIEDVWIHKITIDGSRIVDNFNNLLFRCGNVVLKQSIIGNVYAMNQVVDFYAEQCVFTGDVKFENPTPFGNKAAIGCTFGRAVDESVQIVGAGGGLSESEVTSLIESYIDTGVEF